MVVSHEAAWQQVRFDQDLEAVANAEHRHPGVRRVDDLAHDRGSRCNRATAQVVAVAEPAGQHYRLDTPKVVLAVPQRDRFSASEPHGALRVSIVEGPRECDDANAH
jgi:hypothetical protein